MKRTITCALIMLLCASGTFAQSRRGKRPAGVSLKPGYYFTINMCRACMYPEWHDDAVRLFRNNGIRAIVGKGFENATSRQPFAPLKAFQMRFDSSANDRPSDILMQIDLYVGPFESEQVAMQALDKFPGVLGAIQKKRNKMEEGNEGWPISGSERVRRVENNLYEYGFFFLKGYRLLQ